MSALAKLAACEGSWSGRNRLHDPMTQALQDSDGGAVVTPLLDGAFVRIDYTWAYLGKPQQGSLLVGYEKDGETVTAAWIDSWHCGDKVLVSRGPAGPAETIAVKGAYAAPPGPDWGWRTTIETEPGLRIVMHNVDPDGIEELAVEADYRRD